MDWSILFDVGLKLSGIPCLMFRLSGNKGQNKSRWLLFEACQPSGDVSQLNKFEFETNYHLS